MGGLQLGNFKFIASRSLFLLLFKSDGDNTNKMLVLIVFPIPFILVSMLYRFIHELVEIAKSYGHGFAFRACFYTLK